MTYQKIADSSQKTLLVFGAANLDIVSKTEQLPKEKGDSTTSEIRTCYGGVARNVAENLARLGESVTLITTVGCDNFGEKLLEYTSSSGVNVEACKICQNMRTASYLAIYNKKGELQYAFEDMQAFTALTPEYIKKYEKLFNESKMVFVDTNLPPTTIRTIFSLAKKARIPVCADATSPILANKLKKFINRIFLLTANTYEAAILSNSQEPFSGKQNALESARYLINAGAEICVIPMAEFGVSYATSETSGSIPAMRTTISDPTGAGDALTATIMYGLLNDIMLDDSIRLGVTAASLTLRHSGTVYPDLSIESLYDELVI